MLVQHYTNNDERQYGYFTRTIAAGKDEVASRIE